MDIRTTSALALSLSLFIFIFNAAFGLPVQFLRAESGLLLQIAHSPNWLNEFSRYVTRAYAGHFIPVAFSLELLQTRLFGPNETLWAMRQSIALALLITAATYNSVTLYGITHPGASTSSKRIVAIAIASCFAFNPFVIEMLSWPFMWFQFVCLTGMAVSLCFLLAFIKEPSHGRAFGVTLPAYASIHFLGIGLAISASALATLFIASMCLRQSRKAIPAIVVGLVLTAIHSIPSVMDGGGATGPIRVVDSIARYFTLFIEQPIAAVRATFATPWLPFPALSVIKTQSVLGAGVFVVVGACLSQKWSRAFLSKDQASIASASALTFAFLAFCAICLLSVARLRAETDNAALVAFVIGGRYLIFPIFCAFLAAPVIIQPKTSARILAPIVTVVFAISAVVFVRDVVPNLWPDRTLSHREMWHRMSSNPNEVIDLTRYGEFRGTSCLYRKALDAPPC